MTDHLASHSIEMYHLPRLWITFLDLSTYTQAVVENHRLSTIYQSPSLTYDISIAENRDIFKFL